MTPPHIPNSAYPPHVRGIIVRSREALAAFLFAQDRAGARRVERVKKAVNKSRS